MKSQFPLLSVRSKYLVAASWYNYQYFFCGRLTWQNAQEHIEVKKEKRK